MTSEFLVKMLGEISAIMQENKEKLIALDSVVGDGDLGLTMTKGFAEPVLWSERDDEFSGPGHNGEIFTLSNGRSYFIYHCHWREKDRGNHRPRVMLAQEIRWDKSGWPYVEGNHPAVEGK